MVSDSNRDATIDRRRFVKALSGAGTVGLAGCMGGGNSDGSSNQDDTTTDGGNGGGGNDGGGGGETTIKYWTLFGGGDGEAMKAMVEEFNNQHDGIHIKRQRLPWDEYYNKLYTALTGGNPPDLGVVHATRLAKYKDVLVPLGDHLDSGASDKYITSVWEKTSLDGTQLALPLDTHPVGLYYNKDLFKSAGLDPESPPTNFEELKQAANTITEKTDKQAFNPGPYAEGSFLRTYLGLLRQRGGQILTDDKSKAAFDGEDGIEIAKLYSQMTGEWGWDKADSSVDRGTKAFRAGDLAMTVNGTWYYGALQDVDFEWGMTKPYVAPGGEQGSTWANSHTLAIPRNPNRSQEKTQAAVTAAKWLTQKSKTWGTQAGHLPANKKVLESDEIRNAPVWDKTLSTFYEIAQNDELAYMPRTETITEYKEPIWKALAQIYSQQVEPEQGIKNAAKQVNNIL